jgi:hypothetical protein
VRPKQSSTRTKKSAARKDKPAAPLDWSKVPEELKMLMQIELDRITDDMLCVAVKPGTKIRLGLFKYERDLILNEGVVGMGLTAEQLAELEAAKDPELRLTLAEWEDFHGYVASELNDCKDKLKHERLGKLFDQISDILNRHRESSTRKPGSHWLKSPLFPDG